MERAGSFFSATSSPSQASRAATAALYFAGGVSWSSARTKRGTGTSNNARSAKAIFADARIGDLQKRPTVAVYARRRPASAKRRTAAPAYDRTVGGETKN